MTVFKRGNHAVARTHRPIAILNSLFTLPQFIIDDRVSNEIRLNPNQHGFTKSESAVSNLVMYPDLMTPVARCQSQADAVYSDLPNDLTSPFHP